jgi:electron transport complex protein RnfG
MRDMLKPTLSLFIICLAVAFALAFVNSITKDTIEQRIILDAQEQRKLVLSEADSFKLTEGWEDKDESGLIREVYEAYSSDTFVGYVFSAFQVGFGGEIPVTVGINTEGKITGVKVGSNEETPGLGSKAASDDFLVQYMDKEINQKFTVVKVPAKDDSEIQAVSGATISSVAVTDAVSASSELGSKLLQEQDGGEVK